MAWRNCAASLSLLTAVNTKWPKRQKTSDGTIGDAAHAARTSDHNPYIVVDGVGVVRARDIDKDGIEADWLAEQLRILGAAGDVRLTGGGYVIWNRRITTPDFKAWKPYKGSNPHTGHVHVSFSQNRLGFDSTAPWKFLDGGFPIIGAIREAYDRVGGASVLGRTLGPEVATSDPRGRWQNFMNGRILWHPDVDAQRAHVIQGDIEKRFITLGYESVVGWPITDELTCPDGVGKFNHFAGDTSIYWHPVTGAHWIYGGIRKTWKDSGWERGPLGYPTSEEGPTAEGRLQWFQKGSILWKNNRGTIRPR